MLAAYLGVFVLEVSFPPSRHEATCQFQTIYEAMKQIDVDQVWEVSYLIVLELEAPLASFRPNAVLCKRHRGPEQIWPMASKRKEPNDKMSNAAVSQSLAASGGWGAVAAAAAPTTVAATSVSVVHSEGDELDESTQEIPPSPLEDEVDESMLDRLLSEILADAEEVVEIPEALEVADVHAAHVPVDIAEGLASSSDGAVVVPNTEESGASSIRVAANAIIRGPMFPAEAVCFVGSLGVIRYYASKDAFECRCSKHRGCVLTRTAKSKRKAGNTSAASGGRPLGMMVAWLKLQETCTNKDAHWNRETWKTTFTYEHRVACREELQTLVGSAELLACERPAGPAEGLEPLALDGML
eukprot:2856253-Amphidinium_carterae.1